MEQTSNPSAKRRSFQPGVRERIVRAFRIYDRMHGLHLIRSEEFRRIVRRLNRGGLLLDIACGDGFFTRRFAEAIDAETWGIDLMPSRIEKARFYNQRDRVHFELADASSIPFPNQTFEQVVSMCAIEHFEDDRQVLAEAFRVLKPGGRIVLTCDAFWNVGFTKEELAAHARRYYVQRYYRPDDLTRALDTAGFRGITVEPIYTSRVALALIRGALKFKCDGSNPLYNIYSGLGDPLIWISERMQSYFARPDRGIFLLAAATRS